MKMMIALTISFFLCLASGLVPGAPAAAQPENNAGNKITLTASMVTSAIDIENAIQTVTRQGARPGTIILDGSEGPFVYSGPDRSINLFYPNLTLRGVNAAHLTNADDGFFFDDLPADNIRIEDLYIDSRGGGVVGLGQHANIVISGNTFRAEGAAIEVNHGRRWTITGNTILAGSYALHIASSKDIIVSGNIFNAPTAILIEATVAAQIDHNTLFASQQGILLTNESSGSELSNNTVLCALHTICQPVQAEN